MTVSVLVVWWITLGIALLLTLVAWELLNRVARMAKRIEAHAKRTLPAAVEIANHTASIQLLVTTKSVAGEVLATAQAINEAAGAIEKKLQ